MPAKRPAPRLALIDESHMSDAQRTLLDSPSGRATWRFNHAPRTVCSLDACPRVRRACTKAGRSLPLSDSGFRPGCQNSPS